MHILCSAKLLACMGTNRLEQAVKTEATKFNTEWTRLEGDVSPLQARSLAENEKCIIFFVQPVRVGEIAQILPNKCRTITTKIQYLVGTEFLL